LLLKESYKKLEKIEKVGVVLRPQSPELKEVYEKIEALFLQKKISLLLEYDSALMIGKDGLDFENLCESVDFLISVGGDGTLLGVVRKAFKYDIPVLGINLGTLGFLTDLSMEQLPKFVDDLSQNDYKINSRMIIEGSIKGKNFIAFNDVVLSRKDLSTMLKVRAKIDNNEFNTYFGDGLIVSTPSGSTAYNLSAGGPIVYPLTEAFIITPIAPHSLTQRSLVVPANFEIEFNVPNSSEVVVIVDGQEFYGLKKDGILKIKIATKKAKMLHRSSRDFFKVLSEKLRWGK